MNKRNISLATIVALVLLFSFAWGGFDSTAVFQQDPGTGGGTGGSCNYCSQTACGCAAPPPGTYLSFSCSCSSISCSRSCSYGSL